MSLRTLGLTGLRTVSVAILAVTASACGFRLQGDLALPETVRSLELQTTDRQSEFAHALAARLRDAGVEVRWTGLDFTSAGGASTATTSRAVLRIETDEFIERVASVSARNVPREYELTYRVRYSFESNAASSADTPKKIDAEELSLAREFSFDERAALAKQREREQLRSTLANELAGMVLQRIASLR